MRFMASCLFGLEKPVCDDIAALGYGKNRGYGRSRPV